MAPARLPQDIDPHITWLISLNLNLMRPVEKRAGPVHLPHSKEFAFTDVSITKPIREGSFGKVYRGLYRDDKVANKISRSSQKVGNP